MKINKKSSRNKSLKGKSAFYIQYTVDENIIATIKMQNNFCYPLKMVIFPILR